MNVILVALGGFTGSIARYGLSLLLKGHFLATWAVNLTGSILLAFLFSLHLTGNLSDSQWQLLGIGFCGAYTTFSTFGYESVQLFQQKKYKTACTYVFGSTAITIMAVITVL